MSVIYNPILPGDHPDPSIVRVGSDYYMVTSTFQFFPGVLVLHSKDLAHWEPIGHVVTRKSQLDLTGLPDSFGVFAPDISYYDGKFWVVVPYYHGQPRCTNLLFVADRPEGPYSEATVLNHHFIDPSIFNDDDGKRYLAFGGGWIHELAEDGSRLIGDAKQVWPGTGGSAPEAPHIVKRNGWYYLMLAEGGTFFEHMETLARSSSIWGPYEPCPHNPVMMQVNPEKKIQKAGHGKLVEDVNGDWWMFHLGGRPLTPGGFCPLGRETFLQPVQWTKDDWFVVGEKGIPMDEIQMPLVENAQDIEQVIVEDHFTGTELSPEWEWVRHPVEGGFDLLQEGLQIACKPFIPFGLESTLILTRRWRHFGFEATTKILFNPESLGEEAGITLYRDSDAFLFFSIRRGIGQTSGQAFDVTKLHENQEHDGFYIELDQYVNVGKKILARIVLPIESGDPVWLRAKLDEKSQNFTFYYSVDGTVFTSMGIELSAEFLYPEHYTRFLCFTAPRVGIYAKGVYGEPEGSALFQAFVYRGM
ncbi:glycosyl hydrolase [Paenibacillus baekrokdamisoli]|uniref:Glycosyl hydrolase n=1 Tax=Paenibacillus baekrokdamisoli TaxID=1712516 RepID=A0A3G9J892_9BACL|nr:glycoside hydrolase family 43 protein [Paenibacillus baekrokdamisoli]MBB3067318.1 beta-xylosidase [Paenibacillus baekrokdamisoli]BBH19494.1 glycosyl hydrolase [Paenibacillus baekrokdamisoli]